MSWNFSYDNVYEKIETEREVQAAHFVGGESGDGQFSFSIQNHEEDTFRPGSKKIKFQNLFDSEKKNFRAND